MKLSSQDMNLVNKYETYFVMSISILDIKESYRDIFAAVTIWAITPHDATPNSQYKHGHGGQAQRHRPERTKLNLTDGC